MCSEMSEALRGSYYASQKQGTWKSTTPVPVVYQAPWPSNFTKDSPLVERDLGKGKS